MAKESVRTRPIDGFDADAVERWTSEEVLAWAIEKYHPRLVLSASFGAPEGMALLDMMHRIEPASRVFVLDTGRLHSATYDLIDRVRERGMNHFYESLESRRLCCRIRKVEPMRRYLRDFDAYVTGLRRDQNITRANTPKLELDVANGGLVKINPIADWTHERVMEYVGDHRVPVNRLHARGYPTVGCAPCTRAVGAGDDPRSGRWWWENEETRECGLHVAEDQSGGSGI